MKIPDAKYTNIANHIFIFVFSPIIKLPNKRAFDIEKPYYLDKKYTRKNKYICFYL